MKDPTVSLYLSLSACLFLSDRMGGGGGGASGGGGGASGGGGAPAGGGRNEQSIRTHTPKHQHINTPATIWESSFCAGSVTMVTLQRSSGLMKQVANTGNNGRWSSSCSSVWLVFVSVVLVVSVLLRTRNSR